MTEYSVAEAKNNLPKLIDRALEGEEVVITRHGKVVAELRGRPERRMPTATERKAGLEMLRKVREAGPKLDFSVVDLISRMRDEDDEDNLCRR